MTSSAEAARGQSRPGPSRSGTKRVRDLAVAALPLVLAMRAAATLGSSNWTWGIDAFAHWPRRFAAIGLAVAAAAFLPPVARRLQRLAGSLGRVWDRLGWRGDALVAVAVAALLDALHDPVRLTGDSGVRAGLVGMADPRSLMGLMYPLDVAINLALPRALAAAGWSAENALQMAGAVTGGVFVLVVCRFLREAGARGAALPAGFVVACGGSLLIHFAGYDKFGPLLVGIALAALGALRLARRSGGAWILAAGVAVAVTSHRSGLLLVPGAALVLLGAYRSSASPRARRTILAASVLAALVAGAMVPWTLRVVTTIDATKHLPGGEIARARRDSEVPLPLFKLTNVLNEISFLVPLWLVGAAAAGAGPRPPIPARSNSAAEAPPAPRTDQTGRGREGSRPGPRERGARRDRVRAEAIAEPAGLGIPFLVTLALFIALLVLVEPGGGWARDWDIGTGAGTLVALAAAFALARSPRDGGLSGVEGTIVMVGCVVSVSLWGLHASESIALRRLETLVTAHPRWSAATRGWMYDFAGANALNRGDAHGAVERFQASIDVAGPNPRLFYQIGLAHRAAHEWREAESAFAEAAKRNPAVLGAWRGLAEAALAAGDTATARAAQDSIAAHRPRPAPAAVP